MPRLSEFKLVILYFGVYNLQFLEDACDCDDFTLALNACLIVPGWWWTPRFDCWYNHPLGGPHSELLTMLINDEDGSMNPTLYLIEGQVSPEKNLTVAVKEAKTWFTNWKPWLVK